MLSPANAGQASTAQECLDISVNADNTAIALSYDTTIGDCLYSSAVFGSYPRGTGAEPKFYMRVDVHMRPEATTDNNCLTMQDAEYLIVQYSYADVQCPQGSLDAASGFCLIPSSQGLLGHYGAGVLQDGTWFMLSKDLAIEQISNRCENEQDPRMKFGDTWYCYPMVVVPSDQASVDIIRNNYCAQSLPGSNVVKIDEDREYGYMYWWWSETDVYLGLYQQSGTTFVWYDGSTATNLPWAAGSPDGASPLAIVNSQYTLTDVDASLMGVVPCKQSAVSSAYDASAKFLT